MNNRIAYLILLVSLAIAMESSFATPPSRQSLEELVEVSGLNADLKNLEQTILTTAVESASENAGEDATKNRLIDILLADNLRETFQYPLLLDEVTYFLKKQVSEEDVQEALDWYRSDLGQRIVQAEAAANSSDGLAAIQNEINELMNQQELTNMASEVDEAIGISNAMVDLQINSQKALILAGMAIVAPDEDISKIEHADWSDIETTDREKLRQPIQQQIQATFAYTMKAFSQTERAQYRDFLLKPGSIRIVSSIITGMSKAVEIGAHNFIAELDKDLKNPSPELQQLLSQNSSSNGEPATTSESNSDW